VGRLKSEYRVGIYAGTFNPVHAGHIAFALQAMERAGLDRLYFLPERLPRHKQDVEHFGHRVAMLRQALRPHPKFDVLELDNVSFSVARTLPKLQALFGGDQLVFLFGSDAITDLPAWPRAEQLLRQTELVIGCRQETKPGNIKQMIHGWPTKPQQYTILQSYAPVVSSGRIRQALRLNQPVKGLLSSVVRYSNRNWLYVALGQPATVDKP
jgi:nicotinate-nucleotide adenylyltransferase